MRFKLKCFYFWTKYCLFYHCDILDIINEYCKQYISLTLDTSFDYNPEVVFSI